MENEISKIIVDCALEVHRTTEYNPIFEAQVLTYLRLLNLKLALIINFGERFMKRGIHRVVNGV